MQLYKVLNGLESCHGGKHIWTLGEWVEVKDTLIPCKNGIHLCRREDLVYWLHNDIYKAEYEGELINADDKVVVRKARIIERIDTWNKHTARLFACDCADAVVHLAHDHRCEKAIAISRRYATGNATAKELEVAGAAAWEAAGAAAGAAAREAAWAAARAAAWAAGEAAGEAAGAAAWAVAREAAWAAGAAGAAAETAWAAERAEQTEILFDYLEGRRGR